MNRKPEIAFVALATTALALSILITIVDSEALAQPNGASSNASSVVPKATNQKNLAKPINFTGTIPLRSTIHKAISSQVKISLIDTVSTAQKLVGSNSSATLALLRPLIGYLVYDVHVTNKSNNTSYAIVVDPGNGQFYITVNYYRELQRCTNSYSDKMQQDQFMVHIEMPKQLV